MSVCISATTSAASATCPVRRAELLDLGVDVVERHRRRPDPRRRCRAFRAGRRGRVGRRRSRPGRAAARRSPRRSGSSAVEVVRLLQRLRRIVGELVDGDHLVAGADGEEHLGRGRRQRLTIFDVGGRRRRVAGALGRRSSARRRRGRWSPAATSPCRLVVVSRSRRATTASAPTAAISQRCFMDNPPRAGGQAWVAVDEPPRTALASRVWVARTEQATGLVVVRATNHRCGSVPGSHRTSLRPCESPADRRPRRRLATRDRSTTDDWPTKTRGPTEPSADSLVLVNTGDGKGKSTAAFGVMLRGVARGWQVAVVQFVKSGDWHVGEEKHRPSSSASTGAQPRRRVHVGLRRPRPTTSRRRPREAFATAAAIVRAGEHQLVILDELTYLCTWGWVADRRGGRARSEQRPAHVNLIITGRDAPAELVEVADTVTEMRKVKHAFDAGIGAKRGIGLRRIDHVPRSAGRAAASRRWRWRSAGATTATSCSSPRPSRSTTTCAPRIARHRAERPAWPTIEEPLDLAAAIASVRARRAGHRRLPDGVGRQRPAPRARRAVDRSR